MPQTDPGWKGQLAFHSDSSTRVSGRQDRPAVRSSGLRLIRGLGFLPSLLWLGLDGRACRPDTGRGLSVQRALDLSSRNVWGASLLASLISCLSFHFGGFFPLLCGFPSDDKPPHFLIGMM